ncbi:MAG: AMP-binding protein [Verrucomicrobiota bacterium]
MATDFASREKIAAHQLAKLHGLIATLLPANRFYAGKLSGARVDFKSLEEFSRRIPFTTKAELVADQSTHGPFGTNLTFPLARYTRFHQTSGTTGSPLRWLDTPESWDSMVRSWMEVYAAAGVGAEDRIYFAFSFGPFLGFWLAFDAGQKMGALCIPGGSLNSHARVKAILDNEATVLCCTPTYALHLAEIAGKEKFDLTKLRLKKLIVAGEPGGSIPAIRDRLEILWRGAKIFDHHGMTEVGPVTYECPKQLGILHVIESAYFAEIINPQTGKNISTNETGELVLTTLGRTGSPLLRYRTGDLVWAAENLPCICGRFDLALRGGILGRTDDMIIVRGVNIHPSGIEEILQQFNDIAEFRALVKTQNSMAELSLEIEPKPDCQNVPILIEQIGKKLQATFNLRIAASAVAPQTLPRFEMKAKRWIRE